MKFLLPILLLISSCAGNKNITSEIKNDSETYQYTDQSGEFGFNRQVLVEEKKHKLSTMIKMIDKLKIDKPLLEKTISVSEMGSIKKNKKKKGKNVLRPSVSQHTVWLEGKKYFSQIKVNSQKRILDITMESPESKWNGTNTYPIPQKSGVYCFFTQIPECMHFSGILFDLKNKSNTKLNLGIIFEGFPYLMEQVENIPSEPIVFGDFSFDGLSEDGTIRYALDLYGQRIFYHFNDKFELKKILWVAQGISIIK